MIRKNKEIDSIELKEEKHFDKLDKDLKEIANKQNQLDGIELLKKFPDNSIPAIFFDPQYRGVMDKMNYGNEGARQKERAQLTQMTDAIIKSFITEINRTLNKSGHLFLWIDKFHLVEGVQNWFENTELESVDLITWDKGKIGMGYRTRRRCEYLLIYQKKPIRAKDVWTVHDIPDSWLEKVKKIHPHSKPEELQSALINATVKSGDFVTPVIVAIFICY